PAEGKAQASASAWSGIGLLFGATCMGAIVFDALLRAFLNYDILVRYRNAIAFHVGHKGWDGRLQTILAATVTNLAEFATWLGMPMSVLLVGAIGYALYQMLVTRQIGSPATFALGLGLILAFLCLFGKTKAET